MKNNSFNQRLSPEERLKIIQTVGWSKLTMEAVNPIGWISNIRDDDAGLEISVNINSGAVTNHAEGYSIDIVDLVTHYIPYINNDPATRDSAIKWICEILGKPNNRVDLESNQMKFKHAVAAKGVKYAMVPRQLLKDAAISPTAKLVWIAIQERCGPGKDCSWAGYNKIKKDTGIASRETVRKAVKELVASGYLIEKSRGRGKAPNRYPTCFVSENDRDDKPF